jgi:hypothetical protein
MLLVMWIAAAGQGVAGTDDAGCFPEEEVSQCSPGANWLGCSMFSPPCVCLQSANMEDPAKGTSDRTGKTVSARQAADRQPRRRGSPSPGAEQPPGRCATHMTPPTKLSVIESREGVSLACFSLSLHKPQCILPAGRRRALKRHALSAAASAASRRPCHARTPPPMAAPSVRRCHRTKRPAVQTACSQPSAPSAKGSQSGRSHLGPSAHCRMDMPRQPSGARHLAALLLQMHLPNPVARLDRGRPCSRSSSSSSRSSSSSSSSSPRWHRPAASSCRARPAPAAPPVGRCRLGRSSLFRLPLRRVPRQQDRPPRPVPSNRTCCLPASRQRAQCGYLQCWWSRPLQAPSRLEAARRLSRCSAPRLRRHNRCRRRRRRSNSTSSTCQMACITMAQCSLQGSPRHSSRSSSRWLAPMGCRLAVEPRLAARLRRPRTSTRVPAPHSKTARVCPRRRHSSSQGA